ncbi:hypothetical protein F1880_004278 [Penicillium rolfsii]|nr:hypothetical protein F1880_004278 [Penicillium rolfsii]
MALMQSYHTPLARHILPISFRTSISLIFFLFYLQFLYATSCILRPFWPSNHDPRPLKIAIKRIERRVIDFILEILPPPIYRSPVPSSAFLHEESQSHQSTTAHCASHLGFYRVRSAVPRVVEIAEIPQVYHPGAGGRSPSPNLHRENRRLETDIMPIVSNQIGHGTASISNGVHNDPVFSHCDGMNTSIFPSNNCPNIALASNGNQHGFLASAPTPVQPHLKREEQQRIVPLEHGVTIEMHFAAKAGGSTQPNSSIESPTVSTDEPKTSLDVIPPSSSRYTDNLTDLSLESNRTTKARSTQSYPGKFPVSEGMDYSSLATASSAFREKGTTHVRPFSDY